jgi:hypothetical protein
MKRNSLLMCAGGVGLIAGMLLRACDKSVEQRADAIRTRNAKLDQVSKARVMKEMQKHWVVRDGAWYGKLADGTLLRLESPKVTIEPVKEGKPFCCNWMGEASIQADHWERLPTRAGAAPFIVNYRALLEGEGHYSITAMAGPEVSPPDEKEMAAFALPAPQAAAQASSH